MNIAKVSAFFVNNKFYKDILFADRIQFDSITSIEKLQSKKFRKLINHARKNVPYYEDKLVGISDLDDHNKLGFLTKEKIILNQIKLRSENVDKKRFFKKSTSGSTGESMHFYVDASNLYSNAVAIRGDGWAGLNFGGKALHFWGAERDIENNKSLYKRIKHRYIVKEKMISTFHMSDSNLDDYIHTLNQYRPEVIISYPSPLYHLAKYIKKNQTDVWQPKGIITSAETLFPFQRETIENVFNTRVYNRYGSREFGHIAAECEKHEGLHINSDRLILEIINPLGEVCKAGELGEIVITDLDNHVFPFIRYKTGDIGVLSDKKCSCGRNLPLLERVEGRIFDMIIGINGNAVAGTFWTLLKHKIKGWNKFQIIQEKLDKIVINVEKNEEIEADFKSKLAHIVKDKLGENMDVSILIVDKIPLTKSGKHRWIISKVTPYVQ